MKTKENHYDIQKKNFYSNVKKRADEVQEVLDHAKESTGYCDFDTWYTQEYEWRFLKDILGTNKCFGTQFDYCGLIHLPKIKWTDSEDTEHIHTLIGTHTPGYYGFLTPGNVISSNDTINVSIIEPDESCTEEDDRKISLSVNMDNVQSALKNETGYAANTYLKVVNNGTTEEPDLGLEWVNLGGIVQENLLQWDDTTKELFKGETGKYTIVDDILLGDTTVLNRIKEKSTVTTSATGTATDEVSYITIDGAEKKIAGGISESQVDAKILVETNRATKVEKTLEDSKQDKLTSESEVSVKSINVGNVALNETVLANLDSQVTKNTQAISDEATRAETAEQEISEALMTEQTERLDSEATLQSNIDKKQDTISDLSTIRSNAEKGATAVQPAALDNYYTKDETDSEIDTKISQSVGRYITSSTAGANFATKAALTAGPYYYNGATVTLIATDYAIVAADEDHDNAQTRYIYSGSQWNYQYTISTTITAAQQAALDSGINTTKVAQITTNTTAISTETTERKEAVEACEKVANKTTSITTASTDTEYPSAKAVFTAVDEVYNDLDGRVETIESEYTTTTYVNTQVSTEATTRSEADTTLQTNIDNCEKTANKVTSLSSESTDTEYPTAKCVYDLVGNVETILQTLNTGTGAK